MKLLLACERTQKVCKEFRRRGHLAFSCDTEPAAGGRPDWHYQCDVRDVLSDSWDLIISFPPCDHLASSGAAWFAQKRADGRQQKAIDFFMLFVRHPCKKKAIENPVGIMSTVYRRPDQYLNPNQFGDPVSKKTCLWLFDLPPLQDTNLVEGSKYITAPSGRRYPEWCWRTGGGSGHKRSETYPGLAAAMADQWG